MKNIKFAISTEDYDHGYSKYSFTMIKPVTHIIRLEGWLPSPTGFGYEMNSVLIDCVSEKILAAIATEINMNIFTRQHKKQCSELIFSKLNGQTHYHKTCVVEADNLNIRFMQLEGLQIETSKEFSFKGNKCNLFKAIRY